MSRRFRADETTRELKRLRKRTESSHELVQAVFATCGDLLDSADVEELCKSALQVSTDLFQVDVVGIAVIEPGGRTACVYELEHGRAPAQRQRVATAHGLLGETLRRNELTVVRGAELASMTFDRTTTLHDQPPACSLVLLPLRGTGDRTLGGVYCATSQELKRHELNSLRFFGWHLGAALELVHTRLDLRHWNAIVESSRTAFVGYDLGGTITHWNRAATTFYGYTAQEIVGEDIQTIIPEGLVQEHQMLLAGIRAGRNVADVETKRIAKDGRTVDVALTVSPILDGSGRVVGASAIHRDVTEELRQRALFRETVESAPSAIIAVDDNGVIALANGEAEMLFGYTRDEMAGSPVECLVPLGQRDAHRQHRHEFTTTPSRRAMGTGRELWAVGKDGRRIPVEVGLNPVEVGGRRLVLATVVDISKRRAREHERQRLLQEAQEAVAARDTFLSIASHELRTPLTALQLTVQGMLRSETRARPATSTVLQKLGSANRQVGRLARLIDELLDVSRITAGRLQLVPERVNLYELIKEVSQRFLQDDGPAIRLSESSPVWGSWDASRLDQILTNLIANAVKYGEGEPIDLDLSTTPESVTISIRDHGRGIDPSDQARIFERFERLVSHRHFGGFGLGLWIVRQLVYAHGGQIEVVSESGAGSTFIVTLPLAAQGGGTYQLHGESIAESTVETAVKR